MNIKIWIVGLILMTVFVVNLCARPGATSSPVPQNYPFTLDNNDILEAKLNLTIPSATPTPKAKRFVPFGIGEKFEYSVGWGKVLNAGETTLEVREIIQYQGHDVYRVVAKAKSNRMFSLFYRVRDRFESLIDVNGLFTRRYWTKQDEAFKKRERKYEFDQENNTVDYKDKEYYIRYGIQDEISAIFYIRTLDLQVGKPVYVDIFARRKNWQVKCNVLKTETIKVPAGKFETVLVEPELNFEGIMKKGKMKVWFTNDKRRIPIQVSSKIAIGSILIRLKKYRMSEDILYD
jgi:hypothetical protein